MVMASTLVLRQDGLNRLKLDAQGYNVYGCDLDGRRADGSICPPEQITRVFNPETGLDQFSLDKDGYNEFGCDLNERNENAVQKDIPRIFLLMKTNLATALQICLTACGKRAARKTYSTVGQGW